MNAYLFVKQIFFLCVSYQAGYGGCVDKHFGTLGNNVMLDNNDITEI